MVFLVKWALAAASYSVSPQETALELTASSLALLLPPLRVAWAWMGESSLGRVYYQVVVFGPNRRCPAVDLFDGCHQSRGDDGMLHAVRIPVSFHAGLHVQAVFLLIDGHTNDLAQSVRGTPAGAIHMSRLAARSGSACTLSSPAQMRAIPAATTFIRLH